MRAPHTGGMANLLIFPRTAAPVACAIAALVSTIVREPPSADVTTAPGAVLRVTAVVADTVIAGLVLESTAPDIAEPLRFPVAVENGFAAATIRIPPGRARTIVVSSLDRGGSRSAEGAITVDLVAGANPSVLVPLVPSRPGVPTIDVRLGPVVWWCGPQRPVR